MRWITFAFIALTFVLLQGCGNRLGKKQAASVLGEIAEKIDAEQSSDPVAVGQRETIKYLDKCEGYVDEPYDFNTDEEYESAGILHIDHPSSCRWVVSINPPYTHDLRGSLPDLTGDPSSDNFVHFATAKYASTVVKSIQQDGLHAQVEAVLSYPFTATGKTLMASHIYPKLGKDCMYDMPTSSVQCTEKLPFAFFDNKWQIDIANLPKG